MRIHIDTFIANNPELDFDEIITSISAGVSESGIIHVNIETKDKYVNMNAGGSLYGPDYSGQTINIMPYLSNEHYDDLYESDFDAYLAHPDWYKIVLVVEMDMRCPTVKCTPLKHEYWINYIPHELAFDYDVLMPVEVIGWED